MHFSRHSRRTNLTRRTLLGELGLGGLGVVGLGLGSIGGTCASWVPALAEQLANAKRPHRCILLWMNGGPSQIDTFDMKPGHPNGGEFKERSTAVPGMRFSEHLPLLAQHAQHLAIVRSLSTKEGDHARGAHVVRTGRPPSGDVDYPSIACALARELESQASLLPHYVSVAPQQQLSPAAFGPGFLGARYAPALVAGGASSRDEAGANAPMADLRLEHLEPSPGVETLQMQRRIELWSLLQQRRLAIDNAPSLRAHDAMYRKAIEMMRPEVRDAFDLSRESATTRERYGKGVFGQGCLLARRLVERDVAFVEVALGEGLAWDTHQDNFAQVRLLSAQLDAGWATLMTELEERGLLESTTILWLGEFGRTPAINANAGRDHFPNAWTCVFAGGSIAGGQAFGRTSADGTTIEDGPVAIGDVLATLCSALGIDPAHEIVTPTARPVKLAEGKPIDALTL